MLRALEAGWPIALARPEMTPQADEVAITDCLGDAMGMALAEHRFPWCITIIVAPGTESRPSADIVSPDGRADIPLFLTCVPVHSGEHDFHVILEYKRAAEGDAR